MSKTNKIKSKKSKSMETIDNTDNSVLSTNTNIPGYINLNINNSDEFSPDYLHCWSLFNKKPIKDSFYSFFETNQFFSWLKEDMSIPESNIVCNKDIISDLDVYIINSKYLIKVSDTIYISLVHFNEIYKLESEEELDEDKIGSISIIYKSTHDSEVVESIKEKLFDFEIKSFDDDGDEIKPKETGLRILKYDMTDNKFQSIPIDIKSDIDIKNLDLYYNNDTFKKIKKLIKKSNKSNKGLSILYGERGTGKTSILNYLSSKLNKKIILVPNNIIDHMLYNSEFIEFLKYNTNSILLIDDCENHISKFININSVSSILSLTDGLLSNLFNCQIILTFNVKSDNLIDQDILESNNIIDIIQFDSLTIENATQLSKHLKIKDFKTSNKLINVLSSKDIETTKFGYLK